MEFLWKPWKPWRDTPMAENTSKLEDQVSSVEGIRRTSIDDLLKVYRNPSQYGTIPYYEAIAARIEELSGVNPSWGSDQEIRVGLGGKREQLEISEQSA